MVYFATAPRFRLHPLEHRYQVGVVRRLVRHPRRHYHLVPLIDRELRIVGLDESIAAYHDGALRVGEVALGPVSR